MSCDIFSYRNLQKIWEFIEKLLGTRDHIISNLQLNVTNVIMSVV